MGKQGRKRRTGGRFCALGFALARRRGFLLCLLLLLFSARLLCEIFEDVLFVLAVLLKHASVLELVLPKGGNLEFVGVFSLLLRAHVLLLLEFYPD